MHCVGILSFRTCQRYVLHTGDQFSAAFTSILPVFGTKRVWVLVEGILSRFEVKSRGSLLFITGTCKITFTAGYNFSIKLDCSTPPIYTLRTNASICSSYILGTSYCPYNISSVSLYATVNTHKAIKYFALGACMPHTSLALCLRVF